ncbi:hypothetical protein [Moraxella lacunata]|uniref:hypothetical protein n=1 Tax=Moraxella lacunata TaxID=477 RepID=UPI003EE37C50
MMIFVNLIIICQKVCYYSTKFWGYCDDLICPNPPINRTYHHTLESHQDTPIIHTFTYLQR